MFEHNALELILKYTNLKESKDARLAFEALKYLASLLCHKKFSIEFINFNGLQVEFYLNICYAMLDDEVPFLKQFLFPIFRGFLRFLVQVYQPQEFQYVFITLHTAKMLLKEFVFSLNILFPTLSRK